MLRPRRLLAPAACLAALIAAALSAGTAASTSVDTAELLARYEPFVYAYSSDWNPIQIEPFLASADLERLTGTSWRVVRSSPSAASLGTGSKNVRLDLRPCTPARNLDPCYVGRAPRGSPTVYGRAWTNPAPGTIGTVLEYWFFYPLNDWRNSLTRPTIWQMHEGDWEAVLVGLTSDGKPISVAASQHGLGVVRTWSRARKVGTTHPVAYAALGSHANYLSPGFRGQAGRPHRIPPTFSGVPLAEPDFTATQTSWGPPDLAANRLDVVDVSDKTAPWLGFRGAWGDGEYLLLGTPTSSGGTAFGHLPVGASPLGPAFHRAWLDPLSPFRDWPADDGH